MPTIDTTSAIILITDIFGLTNAVQQLATQLAVRSDVKIIAPYAGQNNSFSCEQMAYRVFTEQVTIQNYEETVRQHLKMVCTNTPTLLIGFSVGATVTWNLAAQSALRHFRHIKPICFYGSQIRQHAHKHQPIPIELILPNKEASFDINTFHARLRTKENVLIHQACAGHGFMNKLSRNYSEAHYQKYLQYISMLQMDLNRMEAPPKPFFE